MGEACDQRGRAGGGGGVARGVWPEGERGTCAACSALLKWNYVFGEFQDHN